MIEILAFVGVGLVAFGAGLALGYRCGVADEQAQTFIRAERRSRRRHPAGRLRVYDGEEGA